MGLFKTKKSHASLALIDIDSASIGAALVHVEAGELPVIYFTVRERIEPKDHEDAAEAMLRTLTEAAKILVSKGAPILHKETGSGSIDRVLVSVGAPWQKTTIHIEAISEKKPFIFTQALLSEVTKKDSVVPKGYVKSEQSVIATLLNGYETPKPFGKKVTRADIIVLSSLINSKVAHEIEGTLRKTYHTHSLTLTAFSSVAYTAFRDIYPHEKDFIVLEISGEATDIAFIKRGLLVDMATITHGMNDLIRGVQGNASLKTKIAETERAWLTNIEIALKEAAVRHALPHTLFLLADPEAREYLKKLLDSSGMRSLWLTDDPLRIISVVPAHFAQFVKSRGNAEGDVFLALLTLFAKKSL